MKFEGSVPGAQDPHSEFGTPIDSPEVQIALTLTAHRLAHPSEEIHTANWEENLLLQAAAMEEWIAAPPGTEPLALRYRKYAEAHPHKRVDVNNAEAIEELLSELSGEPAAA